MAFDLASVANRMAPGLAGTSPQKVAVPTNAGTEIQLRAAAGAARYYSIKVVGSGASVTLATGTTGLAAPTANDPIFEPVDSWQDFVLGVGATHIRLFGTGTGSVYFWDRGS